MAITRANLKRGPGSLTYDSLEIFSQEDIVANTRVETWRPKVSTHGEGAPRISDAIGEVGCTPTGRISAALVAALYPSGFRNPTVGARVFPATDKALLIHGTDEGKISFPNAALTKMPDLDLTPKRTAFGEAMFTALIKDNTERTVTGAFYTVPASATWTGTFDDDDIVAVPYAGAWDSTSIDTEDGWKVTFDVGLEPVYVSGVGTVDYIVTSVTARATCRPVALGASDLLGYLRPEGLALGSTLRQTKNLVITGAAGGLIVTLYDATPMDAPSVWGASASRAGDLVFEASRQLTGETPSTTMGAVFAVNIAT